MASTIAATSMAPPHATIQRTHRSAPQHAHAAQLSQNTQTSSATQPASLYTVETATIPSRLAVDPLSELIYERTHNSISHHSRRPSEPTLTPHPSNHHAQQSLDKSDLPQTDLPQQPQAYHHGSAPQNSHPPSLAPTTPAKDKKKAVKFLSRFLPTLKKDANADEADVLPDDDMTFELRPEGIDAEVFCQPIEHVGYNPRHPQPPGYIKVRSRNKKRREFDRVFLAQELDDRRTATLQRTGSTTSMEPKRLRKERSLSVQDDAIWAMSFSKDGKYVATAGQDKKIRVWAVIDSSDERRRHEKDEEAISASDPDAFHLSAPVFRGKPKCVYEGHTGPILDLCWSKNNFLLSSSMDKTVRLWHVSRSECLCAFKHSDFVTSIRFHPEDDRFFLAGSLDSKLRLWSIPDKTVAYWNNVPDMITSVGFTPDGKTAIAGCLTGLLHFYDTEGLKYQTQTHVKSARGKNAKGSKITGIETAQVAGQVKLLISSNDSRIRLFNFRDKSLEMKFKGLTNASSQIRARFSDDARHVICGSEDNRVYIWSTNSVDVERDNKWPVEVFEAHSATTTCALLAPARTRQLLSCSEDPLYDLCNPPPVHLVSRSEETSSDHSATKPDAPSNSDAGSSIQPTPAAIDGMPASFPRPSESPAYLSRSSHSDCGGAIIVTADATGAVKVFRQDCAYEKRRAADSAWDAASTASRKACSSNASGIIRRTSHHSGVSRTSSFSSVQQTSRINTWRASVSSQQSSTAQGNVSGLGRHPSQSSFRSTALSIRSGVPPIRDARSASPRKSLSSRRSGTRPDHQAAGLSLTPIATNSSSASAAALARLPPGGGGDSPASMGPPAKPRGVKPPVVHVQGDGKVEGKDEGKGDPKEDGKEGEGKNPLARQDSYTYWHRDAWRLEVMGQLAAAKDNIGAGAAKVVGSRKNGGGLLPPETDKRLSGVSALTDNSA